MPACNSCRGKETSRLAFYTASVGGFSEYLSKVEMICSYFRGRASNIDVMNLPIRTLHGLYILAYNKSKTDENKDPTMEDLQDVIEEGV